MCESDARCRDFLAKAWPGVPVWPDVRTFSLADATKPGTGHNERRLRPMPDGCGEICNVWLLTAGVPCQPASRAGKQGGASDERWLWPAAVSVFAAIRPAWGLFENPPGIGDVGLAGILSDLEAQGYAVRVFSVGACALGAPHRRMRYWIVCRRLADAGSQGHPERVLQPGISREARFRSAGEAADVGGKVGGLADAGQQHGEWRTAEQNSGSNLSRNGHQKANYSERSDHWKNYVWLPCADGKVRRAPDSAVELVDGRPVDIIETLAKEGWPHRSVLGALGNSIVWQVAAKIIGAMVASEEMECSPIDKSG